MGWLFAQLWCWLLVSFLLGSVVADVVVRAVSPSIEELVRQARTRAREAR